MVSKPEFLASKKDILVAFVTASVAILSPGMAIKILYMPAEPCKGKGLNWPFFCFSGAFSDYNVGFPQWRGLAGTVC